MITYSIPLLVAFTAAALLLTVGITRIVWFVVCAAQYVRELRARGWWRDGCFPGCGWPHSKCHCGVVRFGEPRGPNGERRAAFGDRRGKA